MWHDQQPKKPWTSLWSGYVKCRADCVGIRKIEISCLAGGDGQLDLSREIIIIDGRKEIVPRAFMGAEGRYEDYVYLQILQREWERPVIEFDRMSHFRVWTRSAPEGDDGGERDG